jgi:predicted DNA-binding antitoxin AbrB/MazE fold protein
MNMEATMEYFTVQAIYEKGVLKPKKKLNLPEHSLVEVRVKTARTKKQPTPFASLLGIWEHLPAKESTALEKALARTRRQSDSKLRRIAKTLK